MLVEVTSDAAMIITPNCPAKLFLMTTSGGYCPEYTPLRASSCAEFVGCTAPSFSLLENVKGTSQVTSGASPNIPAYRGLHSSKCCPRESPPRTYIDGPPDSVYICIVPARKLQVGQVWKKDESGESYLITKIYNEAIATFALLRKTGAEAEGTVKVKVDQRGPAQALPGFTYTQESDSF